MILHNQTRVTYYIDLVVLELPSDQYQYNTVRPTVRLVIIVRLVINVRPTVLNVFSLITHYGSPAGCGGE